MSGIALMQPDSPMELTSNRAVLKAATKMMRHELRRFHLADRERTLAELILSLSWSEGLPQVRVPKLDYFQQLTGIAVPHVQRVLKDLQMMRVIAVEETGEGKFYSVNSHSENWQVKPRQSRTTIMDALNLLREINGVQRGEPLPSFTHPIDTTNGIHGATLNADPQPLQCGSRDFCGSQSRAPFSAAAVGSSPMPRPASVAAEFFLFRVCMSCKVGLGTKACDPRQAGETSHGICSDCKEKVLREFHQLSRI